MATDTHAITVKLPTLRLHIGVAVCWLAYWVVPLKHHDLVVRVLANWVSNGTKIT